MVALEPFQSTRTAIPIAAGVQHFIRQLLMAIKNYVEAAGCDAAGLHPNFIISSATKDSGPKFLVSD
jgi:hypothetical protein